MNIELGKYKEQEKKKKEISEKEKSIEQEKILKSKEKKEKIQIQIETDEKLGALKRMVEEGLISRKTVEKIVSGENIDVEDIEEIFGKIDEIEALQNVDKYLPRNLRLTKEQYIKAIDSQGDREQAMQILDKSLGYIASQISGSNSFELNIFSGYLMVLDKNLRLVQENTIDIKDSLEDIDKSENPEKYKNKKSLWQRFWDFLKG